MRLLRRLVRSGSMVPRCARWQAPRMLVTPCPDGSGALGQRASSHCPQCMLFQVVLQCILTIPLATGVICTCASRSLSCPEPATVGTTRGMNVVLPHLDSAEERTKFLTAHPNYAFEEAKAPLQKPKPAVACQLVNPLVAASLPGCP
jgi:hypothetical protein